MDRQGALEEAKKVLQETFVPEGYKGCRLEGWEQRGGRWLVLLSMEYVPPPGSAGHTLATLTGGRRFYREVAVDEETGQVESIKPVPHPDAVSE